MGFFDLPRGVRNNNPFNIDYVKANDWDGQLGIEPKNSKGQQRFAAFSDVLFGARAFFKTLNTYKNRYKLSTVEGLVERFAPSSENPTRKYAEFVANAVGVGVADTIDLTDKDTAVKIAKAKLDFENGAGTSSAFSDSFLGRAFDIAHNKTNYTEEEKKLSQSIKKGVLTDAEVMDKLLNSRVKKVVQAPSVSDLMNTFRNASEGLSDKFSELLMKTVENIQTPPKSSEKTSQSGTDALAPTTSFSEEEERIIQFYMQQFKDEQDLQRGIAEEELTQSVIREEQEFSAAEGEFSAEEEEIIQQMMQQMRVERRTTPTVEVNPEQPEEEGVILGERLIDTIF